MLKTLYCFVRGQYPNPDNKTDFRESGKAGKASQGQGGRLTNSFVVGLNTSKSSPSFKQIKPSKECTWPILRNREYMFDLNTSFFKRVLNPPPTCKERISKEILQSRESRWADDPTRCFPQALQV